MSLHRAKNFDPDNSDDHRHGTYLGYQYGCRCARCSDARRREFPPSGVAEVVHTALYERKRQDKRLTSAWRPQQAEALRKTIINPPTQEGE